ncbi:MAG TPA: molybdopterin-synthase adenylyltransferase MoeB [Methylomirabilota bacterium]|nr:molybdopterin-synthase adenylyltransferase MoeB [Methylomirabilota bacterium]
MRPVEASLPELSLPELRRYGRHLTLAEMGEEGQKRLKAGSVLVVGAGGLGSPLALYLAAAGVGTIGIVDFDAVEESNLQRQIAHGTASVGKSKLASITARLADLNPYVTVVPHEAYLHRTNALEIVRPYDVIVDGTDNFATRYLVNDACVLEGKPNVYGSILRFEGQASVFDARIGPCYRCLFPEPPPAGVIPNCAEAGVLGVLPGVIGSIQATEAIKLLIGAGDTLVGRLLLYDALEMRFREMRLRKDPRCPICGEQPSIRELQDYDALCGVKPHESAADQIGARELADRLARGEDMVLVDVREPHELAIAKFPNAVHVPLRTVPTRASELPRERLLVLTCHKGVRSQRALEILRELGFTRLKNLAGGIDSWSREVDSSVPRY